MPTSPSDSRYANRIFRTLNLAPSDRKYIYIRKDAIFFSFPLKLKLELWAGDKKLLLDKKAMNGISESIIEFLRYELYEGHFKDVLVYSTAALSERQEMEFYRDICCDEEAIEAVRWLMKFKKRFGF